MRRSMSTVASCRTKRDRRLPRPADWSRVIRWSGPRHCETCGTRGVAGDTAIELEASKGPGCNKERENGVGPPALFLLGRPARARGLARGVARHTHTQVTQVRCRADTSTEASDQYENIPPNRSRQKPKATTSQKPPKAKSHHKPKAATSQKPPKANTRQKPKAAKSQKPPKAAKI